MCVLRVSGKRFDPVAFLKVSRLEPYSVFQVGEPTVASRPNGGLHAVSGFQVDVSRSSWDSLAGQVADAVAFLKRHRRALERLRSTRGVDSIRLDFPVDLRIDRKTVFAQFDYFPPKLVSLAGALNCGLEISIYPRDLEQLARARTAGRKRSATRGANHRTSK